MEKNNRVKIGARILSKDQVDKLLPSNGNIMNQIAYIRNVANSERNSKNVTSKKKNWDREFDRHFNNIFSILGGRGSGKTSVLLTMKYRIQYLPGETDIILPLIVPEKMGKVSEVLGCILGLLGDIVEEYDKFDINVYEGKRERKDVFEDCRKKKSNILKEKYYDLLKQHRYTHADYRHILVKEYVGFSDYVSNSSHVLDSDQKLVVKFEEFIEELLKFKKIDNNKLGNKEEPLIFIFFDDVDLSTDRCAEVLNVILRYLSHSNIIVFVAGNYLTFSEVLTINALKKDNLLNSEMKEVFYKEKINEQKNALNIRMELTQDLLKKAMPPTYRYNMPLLDEKAKAEFEYATENTIENNDEGENIKNTIVYLKLFELIIKDFIDIDYCTENKKKSLGNNFLYYNNELLYVIFKIFDNSPRGVMNVYYFLHSIQEERIIEEKDKILRLKRFLDTIIRSSTLLSKYENDIYRIIDLKDSYKNTFIDYNYIEIMIEEQDRKINSMEKYTNYDVIPTDDIVTIFILAYFIENIIIFETKGQSRKRKTHGTDVLWKILNSSNKNFSIYPKINDVQMLLKMYEKISATISQTNISNFHHNKYFMGKYFEVLDSLQRDKLSKLFQNIYFNDKDRKWTDEKIDLIMKYGGGLETIIKENINYVYDIAKKMHFDKETLEDIAKHIKYLNYFDHDDDHYYNDYEDDLHHTFNKDEYLDKLKTFFDIKYLEVYIKNGIMTKLDYKNQNYENLLNYFDDRLLDFEIRLKRINKVIYLNQEIVFAYQEILDSLEKYKDRNDNFGLNGIMSKYKFIFIENYHNYIIEEELNAFLSDFRYEIRNSRAYPRSYQESLTSFYEKLKKLESVVPNDQFQKLEIDILELIKIFIDYVKAKTILDINTRQVSSSREEDEKKESFYIMFERLKEELFDTNKMKHKGFYEYIVEKENESKKVHI